MQIATSRALLAFSVFFGSQVLAAEGLSPFDVAKLKSVGSVAISPEGSHVAYTVTVPRDLLADTDGASWVELHVAGRDGSTRPYVSGEVNVSAVRWSRDGKWIGFLAKRGKDDHRCLYAISADGWDSRRLIAHATDIESYSWSPDGKRIAFLAPEEASSKEKKLEKQWMEHYLKGPGNAPPAWELEYEQGN
jgi:dipeptidyl aminopeptidase/acylaminoacyl peptidase